MGCHVLPLRAGQRCRSAPCFLPGLTIAAALAPPRCPMVPQALQDLAASRELIIFDNQRAGLSNDSATGPLSVEGMAGSTMALVRALQLDRPDVLGFSLGGMVALALAAEYSDELGAVVSGTGSRARRLGAVLRMWRPAHVPWRGASCAMLWGYLACMTLRRPARVRSGRLPWRRRRPAARGRHGSGA